MRDNLRCKIDTAVFEKVNSLVSHFSRSIQDIQTNINQFLKDASEDFAKQLEAIEQRLIEAQEDEERKKEAKENAKVVWDNAIITKKKADSTYQQAIVIHQTAINEYTQANANQAQAYTIWQAAFQKQQNAYYDMKDHIISHDDFMDYKYDTDEKKEVFVRLKAVFDANKKALSIATEQKNLAKNQLKNAERQESQAEKQYQIAEKQYDKAIKIREMRVANLKEAKELVLKFEVSKDNYYHPYLFEPNKSCDVILTQLRTDMIKEFGQAMEEIEAAVYNILRCSLIEGVDYDNRYVSQNSANRQKSWEERNRIKEGLRDNRVKLNLEMKTPEDEHPNYAERCKGCGRLISLCICPSKDAPISLNE